MAAYSNNFKSIKNGNVLYSLFKETMKCMLMVYFRKFSLLNQKSTSCFSFLDNESVLNPYSAVSLLGATDPNALRFIHVI